MNGKSRGAVFMAFAIIAAAVVAFIAGRSTGGPTGDGHAAHAGEGRATASAVAETIWTCSMHPQVRQPGPGSCPICGMDLIPAAGDDDSADDSELPRLSVSPRSAALMNIQTWPARQKAVELQKPLLGRVRYDETRTYDVVVRTDSYIERLFTNFSGAPVRAGEHLAELYSPDIFGAAEDLLIAARMNDNRGESSVSNARQRLRLRGVADREIDRILETGEAPATFTIYSPHTGVINKLGGREGHWLREGEQLVEIVDTSGMWIWLDVYERDISFIHHGQPIHFTVKSLPGREFTGAVAFVPPYIDREARVFRVRVNVPNDDGALRDGMFVRAVLEASVDSRGRAVPPDMEGKWISPMHPEIVKEEAGECDVCGMDLVPAEEYGLVAGDYEAPLVIPASAALITGRRAVVYVKIRDTERPTFELRQVELGPRAGSYYVVFSGLDEGDQVVTHGNFKIDSELQLRGRPSMMAPEGGAPPAHDHGAHGAAPQIDPRELPDPADFAGEVDSGFGEEIGPMVTAYLELAEHLAADDGEAAREALATLHRQLLEIGEHRLSGEAHVGWMEHYDRLRQLLHRMEETPGIDGLREHLQELTREMERIYLSFGGGVVSDLYRAYCPMVDGDRGGSWLQTGGTINNPYFGAMMLRCGEILGELGDGE